jgi:hypothetical protein
MDQPESHGTTNTSWLRLTRRRLLGGLLLGTGWLLSGVRMPAYGEPLKTQGNVLLGRVPDHPPGLEDAARFTLMDALYGRRSRRFSMGAEIPDGVMAFKSDKPPLPLEPLEQMLVLTAAAGNTGWHYMIYRDPSYAPHLSSYSAAAGGRTFPSPAGWQVVNFFYTDDQGVYYLPTRDAPSLVQQDEQGHLDLNAWLAGHRRRVRRLGDGRLHLPAREPFIEGHNTWCANRPGSTLVIPVVDMAQMTLNALSFMVSNGICLYDDVNRRPIPGIERFKDLVDVEHPWPLSVVEQEAFAFGTAELTTSCYAGMLMLQALGLGGWMFSGIDMYAVLGASGDPEVPGLGFRFDRQEEWAVPNVTGLDGVYEAYCPPHFADMHAAVEALTERKFGPGGPFHPDTPGPWKDSAKVRSAARRHDARFKECVATMAQYVFDSFGKFPGTVPTMYILTYLQAHHLDLDFYDHHYKQGAYLRTHAEHMARWHAAKGGGKG